MAPTLPIGTVTFLFTDIEGSTRLLRDLGDRYADVLADQHALLQELFRQHGGQVVDTQGDAIFVAFPRATDALAAAIAAQRALARYHWPEEVKVRVRMGLHTGEPLRTDPRYVGMDVHRAARICASGHGGQILLSETTYGLVQDVLADGIGLRDLGEHRLKDLARPQRLFQVVVGDLANDFPPLRSLNSLPNNLPLQLTSFLGRMQEMVEVKTLLHQSRLLTLTGIGGAGKTRLALQIAADVLEEYGDGVWVAELAPLSDAELVTQTLAGVLSLREQHGRAVEATLIDFLQPRHLLLVWDNCEHLLAGCAFLAEKLLRTCPKLHILATSREGLGLAGERTYSVPSLGVPDPRQLPPFASLVQEDAVRLFVERATFASPGFRLTERNATAVVQICHRLDGIPLAIELAAGRVKGMSVEQIASRLDDRFRLLTGGSRTARPQQQTLRAAMDWSFGLLSEAEQILLRRLAVFVGGWTLEAAEIVCSGDPIAAVDVLDLLMRMLDKSLVLAEDFNGTTRYRFLETVRQYSLEKLIEGGETEPVRERHLDWCVNFAGQAEPHLTGAEQVAWLDRLEVEHHNFRAALEWSTSGDATPERGLRLAASLWRFWNVRGYWREGREWLESALTRAGTAPASLRQKGLFGAGVLAWFDVVRAVPLLEESLALARSLQDKGGIAHSLRQLALTARWRYDFDRARVLGEESLGLFRELSDVAGASAALRFLAFLATDLCEFDRAIQLFEESLKIAQLLKDKRGQAWSLGALAAIARARGDYVKGVAMGNEALSAFRDLGDKWGIANCLTVLGNIARCRGDYEQSLELLDKSADVGRELGDTGTLASSLYLLGLVAQDRGDYPLAKKVLEECIAVSRKVAPPAQLFPSSSEFSGAIHAHCIRALAMAAHEEGNHAHATAQLEESLAIFRRLRIPQGEADVLESLGTVAYSTGKSAQAGTLFREALTQQAKLGDKRGVAKSLEGLAAVAASQQQFQRAATLFGAASALREAIGAPVPPTGRGEHEERLTVIRAHLTESAFNEVWTRGGRMSREDAVAFGLEET